MVVEAVNNNNSNRNTAYTLGGVGVGALAGAGYSQFIKKPLLNGEAPSDEFVKTVYENQSKQALANAETAAKKVLEAFKDSDLDVLKAELIGHPDKYGFKFIEADASKGIVEQTVQEQVQKYVKNGDADLTKEALLAKMEKSAVDTATAKVQNGIKDAKKIQSAIQEAGKLAADAKEEDLVKFVTNNKEIYGLKTSATADEIKTFVQGKNSKSLKETAEALFDGAKGAIKDNWDTDKKALKALGEAATDDEKAVMKVLQSAAKHVQGWSAAKWAGIGAAALGVVAYIGAKVSQPKAPVEEAEALQAHQA